MPRTLALIPAEDASTRLPRKNIRSLSAWTVDAVHASSVADRLIVSKADERVAAEVRRLCPDVPFIRPAELTRDPAGVFQTACSYITQPLYAYLLPWARSMDIDTELHWPLAQAMPKAGQGVSGT